MPATTDDDLLNAVSLSELQAYVKRTGQERGFSDETAQDSLMLILEELGEVAKAMRPLRGIKVASDSFHVELAHELADVQLLLLSLSNKLHIDLGKAVISKERRNRQREWK